MRTKKEVRLTPVCWNLTTEQHLMSWCSPVVKRYMISSFNVFTFGHWRCRFCHFSLAVCAYLLMGQNDSWSIISREMLFHWLHLSTCIFKLYMCSYYFKLASVYKTTAVSILATVLYTPIYEFQCVTIYDTALVKNMEICSIRIHQYTYSIDNCFCLFNICCSVFQTG